MFSSVGRYFSHLLTCLSLFHNLVALVSTFNCWDFLLVYRIKLIFVNFLNSSISSMRFFFSCRHYRIFYMSSIIRNSFTSPFPGCISFDPFSWLFNGLEFPVDVECNESRHFALFPILGGRI